jgi:hypothetical protein
MQIETPKDLCPSEWEFGLIQTPEQTEGVLKTEKM